MNGLTGLDGLARGAPSACSYQVIFGRPGRHLLHLEGGAAPRLAEVDVGERGADEVEGEEHPRERRLDARDVEEDVPLEEEVDADLLRRDERGVQRW